MIRTLSLLLTALLLASCGGGEPAADEQTPVRIPEPDLTGQIEVNPEAAANATQSAGSVVAPPADAVAVPQPDGTWAPPPGAAPPATQPSAPAPPPMQRRVPEEGGSSLGTGEASNLDPFRQ